MRCYAGRVVLSLPDRKVVNTGVSTAPRVYHASNRLTMSLRQWPPRGEGIVSLPQGNLRVWNRWICSGVLLYCCTQVVGAPTAHPLVGECATCRRKRWPDRKRRDARNAYHHL
jgi:hypothetical protein